jgi:putative transposase
MIDSTHRLPIAQQARVLDVARSTVYYLPRPTSDRDLELMRQIDQLHLRFPFMGARCLRLQLLRLGFEVGRRHIGTLMAKMDIYAVCPQPGTSKQRPGHKIYPYLLRHLSVTHSNQVWALDTTYVRMSKGFVYLTAVIDVFSRKILAHTTALTLQSCHAVYVLNQAFAKYGTPSIVNVDQGTQFTDSDFTDAVLAKCQLSMDGKGAWKDNVFIERFWRSVKYERVYLRAYETPAQARTDITQYIDWYNNERSHSSLEDQTPAHFYNQGFKVQTTKAA